jgi:hypothetical protein
MARAQCDTPLVLFGIVQFIVSVGLPMINPTTLDGYFQGFIFSFVR